MKNITKQKKLYKKILIIAILIYIIYVFANQQKVLNSYVSTCTYYEDQIEKKVAYQETLKQTKENINSEEYIEEIAREKLDMYLPNEKVYIDKSK